MTTPSEPDDRETDAFFDALAGKASADGAPAGARALRDALQAQACTLREAEQAPETPIPAEQQARWQATRQQLIDRGVFAHAAPRAPASADPAVWLQHLRRLLFGSGWQRPLALAASVLLASVLVLQLAMPPGSPVDIERGAATPVVIAADPAAEAQSLTRKLEAAGADVLLVQINAQEWSLQVGLPRKADPAVLRKALADAGVSMQGEPPYRISVRAQR